MGKSHGTRKNTRDKLSKSVRSRGVSPVIKAIADYETGAKVHVIIDPSIHRGMPHPKFQGKTGTVVGKRGRAFVLEVRDGDADKCIIVFPEHLSAQK
jgi:large subunit ribosomal protein L21e